jgi:hypothetical protein
MGIGIGIAIAIAIFLPADSHRATAGIPSESRVLCMPTARTSRAVVYVYCCCRCVSVSTLTLQPHKRPRPACRDSLQCNAQPRSHQPVHASTIFLYTQQPLRSRVSQTANSTANQAAHLIAAQATVTATATAADKGKHSNHRSNQGCNARYAHIQTDDLSALQSISDSAQPVPTLDYRYAARPHKPH